MADVTRILSQMEAGDPSAAEQLLPLVYDELRKLAAAKLAHEKPGQTLDATALVHEAYLRLAGSPEHQQTWDNRRHFFAAAAEAMRRILIENARRKSQEARGGNWNRIELCDGELVSPITPDQLLAVDDALAQLEAQSAEVAALFKLRYFAGCSVEEAGEALGISRATAYRHWTFARAWLLRYIHSEP
jgi:RNA polymerase sigma factor (TIGR02999 family)